MKLQAYLYIALAFLTIASCSSDHNGTKGGKTDAPGENLPIADNSQTSLDWAGTYEGTIPCADCSGISTTLTLNQDNTFRKSEIYQGKSTKAFMTEGTFSWDEDGQRITTTSTNGDKQQYFVGENVLFHLDKDGQRIEGNLASLYRLARRLNDPLLEGHRWVLTEVMGEAYTKDEKAFIRFDAETFRMEGNNGCNAFSGKYRIQPGQRLSISTVASTLMACPDPKWPEGFMEALQKVDNYTVSENQLSMSKAKTAPLIRFEIKAE
jgi:YD repeat-containing protein